MSSISSLCRTCMINVVDDPYKDIYSFNIFETEGLAEKLTLCSNIEIQPNDEYPPNVCNVCCVSVLDFCDFRNMCRNSLDKFNKMLEKQAETYTSTPNILPDYGSALVPNESMTSEIDIKEEPYADSSDNEMILGDNFMDNAKEAQEDIEINFDYDFDGMVDSSDPLSFTSDSVIVEALGLAKRETKKKRIHFDHNYSLPYKFAEVHSVVGPTKNIEEEERDVSGNENDTDFEYNNIMQIIRSFNESSPKTNPKILKNGKSSTDANTKEGVKEISNEENIKKEINILEELPLKKSPPVSSKLNLKILKNHKPGDDAKTKEDIKEVSNEENIHKEINILEELPLNKKSPPVSSKLKPKILKNIKPVDDAKTKEVVKDVPNEENINKEINILEELSSNRKIFAEFDVVLSQTGKAFPCDICPQTFNLKQRLIDHKRRHHDLSGHSCPHDNCKATFKRLVDLRKHINDHDRIPPQIYKCDVCNDGIMGYTTKGGLQIHMRKCHNNGPAISEYKFICETCGTSFNYQRSLQVHQYLHVDESLWPFKCDINGCTKTFRSVQNYKIHKNRHYGIKLYACPYCDKRFCSNPNLQMHINYHTLAKKWTCSFCPKVCYTPSSLRLHVRSKHQNHPDDECACRICNQIFSSIWVRRYHERKKHTLEMSLHSRYLNKPKQTHIADKKFICRVCNRTLTTAASLKCHEMSHTGEKPFECDACGVKFRYQKNIWRHRKLCRKSKTMKDKKNPAEKD